MGFRDSGFQGPPTGRAFNSANFISQSLFAGGLPMTNPDPSYFDSGWYASLDSLGTQRVGNSVWMNHSGDYEGQLANDTRLIGYLSGSALAGSDKAWGFVGKVYSVNIRDVFNVGPNGLPMLDPSPYPPGLGTVKDVQALQELMSALRGVGIGKGDYIFIDAPNEGDIRAPHGFIIVGEGPAVSCDDDYLNEGALHLNLGISDSTLGALPQVFYVADDSGRPPSHKQRPTPRPFYCSRFKVGGNDPNIPGSFDTQLFVHDRWDFYKIPTTLTIPCDRIYRDPDGSIPKADNSIIIE